MDTLTGLIAAGKLTQEQTDAPEKRYYFQTRQYFYEARLLIDTETHLVWDQGIILYTVPDLGSYLENGISSRDVVTVLPKNRICVTDVRDIGLFTEVRWQYNHKHSTDYGKC